jgi:flagellar biogenesis protein FliO
VGGSEQAGGVMFADTIVVGGLVGLLVVIVLVLLAIYLIRRI